MIKIVIVSTNNMMDFDSIYSFEISVFNKFIGVGIISAIVIKGLFEMVSMSSIINIITVIIKEIYILVKNIIKRKFLLYLKVVIWIRNTYQNVKQKLKELLLNLRRVSLIGNRFFVWRSNIIFLFLFDFDRKLVDFVCIWPPLQWVTSLVSLVLMYWFVGRWYNKRLEKEGGWISAKARILMIFFDLFVNLGIGIYYMDHRETIIGVLMMRCPIAISPLIFILEFLVFVIYFRKYILPLQKKTKEGESIVSLSAAKEIKCNNFEGKEIIKHKK